MQEKINAKHKGLCERLFRSDVLANISLKKQKMWYELLNTVEILFENHELKMFIFLIVSKS